ncbi:MAG: hypothetical protein JWQ43_2963 [Glaciihabitans sp.]|nr:hypothetical protein [Glaciihabitans sp.]
MSDVAKYLPLSQRGAQDESAVTSDWSSPVALVLGALADLLVAAGEDRLDSPALRPGFSIRMTVQEVLWRLDTTRTERLAQTARHALRLRRGPSGAVEAIIGAQPALSLGELVSRLRELSAGASGSSVGEEDAGADAGVSARTAKRHRRPLADLSAVVIGGYDVASSLGLPLVVDAVASGAVALARSLDAPVEVRAVLKDRRMVASDADWSVGQGRELAGSAQAIVLFLAGRGDIPQTPPRQA